ncbi:hypothetical protein [Jatrophihabitans sp.]
MPRIRRPLLALVVLVAALAIGYGVRAAHHDGQHTPTPSTSSHS